MKTFRIGICLLLSIISYALSVNAQEHQSLRGRVLDNRGTAVVGAVVSSTELPDSTAVVHWLTVITALPRIILVP